MKNFLLAVCLVLIHSSLYGATYYVSSTSGNDTRSTVQAQSIGTPWATIQKCSTNAVAGDTCMVLSGTYNEQVTVTNSGSSGSYIVFAGYQHQRPIMRGFSLAGKNYIKIIGFEITHINTSYAGGILITGASSYIEILDNYIHHVNGHAVSGGTSSTTATYITVRGNEMYYANCVTEGVTCSGNGWGVRAGTDSSYWLVEYNKVHRCGDFMNLYGHHHVVRNNYMYDFADAYFTGTGIHVDFFQPGSDAMDTGTRNHVYESNVLADNVESNSHVWQMRDTVGAGDTNILARGNVVYNVGSYILQAGAITNVWHYNNTFHQVLTQLPSGMAAMRYNAEGGVPSTGNQNFNNIFSAVPTQDTLILADGGASVTASNNLCDSTPNHSSCVSHLSAAFVSASNRDFRLTSGSGAIGSGKAITTVTSVNGTGTSFTVNDPGLLFDGWGMTSGDTIKVGNNSPVRIASVSSNTVTVDTSISWSTGDGVFWRNQNTSPDIGAYDYRVGAYDFGMVLSNPRTGSVVSGSTPITVSVTDADLVRFVVFYVNGVPVAKVDQAPYTYQWNSSGLPAGVYLIKAKAFPLYANRVLYRELQSLVGLSVQPTLPSSPTLKSVQ